MPRLAVVLPCFDESERLPEERLLAFASAAPDVGLVLVDDGSRDGTLQRLEALAARRPDAIRVVALSSNRGKGEAVRAGLLSALEHGAECVGYWDADLAAPLEEVERFAAVLDARPEIQLVFGSRVALLGRSIRRSGLRHYAGRVFATLVAETLRVPVYDTQCGAKLLRATPMLREVLAEPFFTRWLFDVELLARWIERHGAEGRARVAEQVYELPLDRWHDVPGSKVRPLDFGRGLLDLARIRRRHLAR